MKGKTHSGGKKIDRLVLKFLVDFFVILLSRQTCVWKQSWSILMQSLEFLWASLFAALISYILQKYFPQTIFHFTQENFF